MREEPRTQLRGNKRGRVQAVFTERDILAENMQDKTATKQNLDLP